jgi:hypothetical protein
MDRLRDEAWSRNAVDRSNLLLDFSKPPPWTDAANTPSSTLPRLAVITL